MLKYDDLLKNKDNNYLQSKTKILQTKLSRPLDLNNPNDKWLAVTYVYAIRHKLREYQARSFASELTLFLTGQLYDTDVYLVYREAELDSHLFRVFDNIKKEHNSKEAYLELIKYMLDFYQSDKSWKYERVSKYLQFRCTTEEKQMYKDIPMKPKQTLLYLLKTFDYTLQELDYERRGQGLDTTWSINLTPSEYYQFLEVLGDTKTDKFLNLLYFYYLINEDDLIE